MFRRSSAESQPEPTDVPKPNGKGRPTPTRKEAEEAAKLRARPPRTRKEMAQRQRELRLESSQKVRAAMKSGDDANLPPRDKGPVRRFVRDFVDCRLNIAELLAPLLILILLLGTGIFGNGGASIANGLWLATILLVVGDTVMLRFRVRKAVRQRFPDAPLKGLTVYAIMRAVNMRFLRLPKPQVKIGQPLPEHYR